MWPLSERHFSTTEISMLILGQKGAPNSQLGVHVYIVILLQGEFNEEGSQLFNYILPSCTWKVSNVYLAHYLENPFGPTTSKPRPFKHTLLGKHALHFLSNVGPTHPMVEAENVKESSKRE